MLLPTLPPTDHVARPRHLLGDGDLVDVRLRQAPGDQPVAVEVEEALHAALVDAVEVELGVAGKQVDVEIGVGVAADEVGAGDLRARRLQLVESGLGRLERTEAVGQPVERLLELVDGIGGGGRHRKVRDRSAGIVKCGAVSVPC